MNAALAAGCAYVDGQFVPIADARIPLLDMGFSRSDCTYDVVAVWQGGFFRLDAHLDRFARSCACLQLAPPVGRDEIARILHECVGRSGLRDAYVEMIATRGVPTAGERDPRRITNRFYAYAIPYVWIAKPDQQAKGLHLAIARNVERISPRAVDPTVKNLQWGDFTRGILEARDRGAMYPILTDGDANLTEGSGFNVVLVKDRTLHTPRRGVLEGVTRRTVLEVADALGLPWVMDDVPVSLAYECDEMMLVTTAGGVMPITTLDDRPIGDGRVGPVTRAIWQGYWDAHADPALSFPIEYR